MADTTLRDVARASGCSVSTVSRVLAGTRPVGETTARRVREAAERLGYRPNQVARALRSRSTGTIGLVLPQITNPFYPALVRELTHALHADGRAVLLADCDDDPEAEAARIASLLDRQVDALLVVPADERRSREAVAAAAERVPLVLLDRGCGPGVADSVAVDNSAGMALVLDHLRAAGRRRPCFVGATGTASAAAERRAAYEAAVRAAYEAEPRVELGDFSVEFGREAVDRLLASPDGEVPPGAAVDGAVSGDMPPGDAVSGGAPSGGVASRGVASGGRSFPFDASSGRPFPFDAVVCANDLIAVGVLQRLRQLGADVPGEVAVTGFDDIAMAALADPELTTVRQPVAELAAEAARLLEQRLSGARRPGTHRAIRLAPELVVRASSAPPVGGSRGVGSRVADSGVADARVADPHADGPGALQPAPPHLRTPHPRTPPRDAEAEQ